MANIGYNVIGGTQWDVGADRKAACKFTSPAAGTIQNLIVYCSADVGPLNASPFVYSDNAGAPNALLTANAPGVTAIDNAAGWETIPLDAPLAIGNGTVYWLGVQVAGGAWNIWYDAGAANQAADRWDAPPLSDPFGAPAYSAFEVSIYATITPVGGVASKRLLVGVGL